MTFTVDAINDLIGTLIKIREYRVASPETAWDRLTKLTPDQFPNTEFKSGIGLLFDFESMLFYVRHDWDNEYADVFLDAGIKELRRVRRTKSDSRLTNASSGLPNETARH